MRQHIGTCGHQLSRLGLTLGGRRTRDVARTPAPSPYVLATYDRKRLYDEVWSEPTQAVARKYGISDVALSKACKQLHNPKPPRGYWAKKVAGKPSQRRPKLAPLLPTTPVSD
jgi:hypothetical protein